MPKLQEVTVWYVTLPNGKRVEVDSAIAERYFGPGSAATPFSKLKLQRVVKRVRVSQGSLSAPKTRRSTRRRTTAKRTARRGVATSRKRPSRSRKR